MDSTQLKESLWKRSWKDAGICLTSRYFVIFTILCIPIGALTIWYWGFVSLIAGILLILIGATIRTPIVQRNELRVELNKHEQKQPDIEVEFDSENNYVRLKITNNGGKAKFKVTAQQLKDGKLIDSSWPVHWRGTSDEWRLITQGDPGILDIASIEEGLFVINEYISPPYIRFYAAKQSVGQDTFGQEKYTYYHDLDHEVTEATIEIAIISDPMFVPKWEPQRYTIWIDKDSKIFMRSEEEVKELLKPRLTLEES